MKKLLALALIMLAFGLTAAMIHSQSREAIPADSGKAALPAEVKAIVDHSCSPCHFEGGSGMALSNVNFSAWDAYSAQKQAKKSAAICKVILNKSMPPAGIIKDQPDKAPTKEQAEVICKWAEGLVYKK